MLDRREARPQGMEGSCGLTRADGEAQAARVDSLKQHVPRRLSHGQRAAAVAWADDAVLDCDRVVLRPNIAVMDPHVVPRNVETVGLQAHKHT